MSPFQTNIALRGYCLRICLAFSAGLHCGIVQAANYFVAMTGNDGPAVKGTKEAPFRTIAYGSSRMAAGDTLFIRKGTYQEAMIHGSGGFSFRNGTSLNAMTRYSSYQGELVTVRPALTGPFVVKFPPTAAFVELSGLVIDGTNAKYYNVKLDSDVTKRLTPRSIRLQGNEIKNGRMGIGGAGNSCQYINNNIHHVSQYGMYSGESYDASGSLYDGNIFHDNGGYGISLYSSPGGVDNNVIRNNIFFKNGSGFPWRDGTMRKAPALLISSGKNNQAYNNIVYGNHEIGIYVAYGAANSVIANNTVYGNALQGILVTSGPNTRLVNNLSWGNKGAQILIGSNVVATTKQETNWTVDPKVVDAPEANFRLRPDSPVIDKGTPLSQVTTDLGGVTRAQGKGYDIGAYEFRLSGAVQPNPPASLQVK